jgi:type I restriction enzyme S subunit
MFEQQVAEQPPHEYQRFLKSLPADWICNEIRQLGTVVGGGTPSRDVPSFWRGSISWVTPGEVSSNATRILHDTNEHISASGLAGSGANLLPAGSLMVTTRATLGARAINAVPMATNQGFKSIVFKQAADAAFYLHLFEKVRPELLRRASGTTFLEISGAEFASIEVPSPCPHEKRLITNVLDTLDTAIHETEAIIAKLRAVKKGLLHDLLTRGIDDNGELRPPEAETPHLYKESPLGWIPKDWAFGALLTWLIGKPRNGYSPQEAGEWTGTQMLGLGCLTNEGFEPAQLKPAPRGDRSLAMALLTDGDLLMSRSNTRDLVGLAGVYRDVGTPCTYPDLMMRLRPCVETSSEFLQFVLRSPGLRRQIQAHAVGTSGSMVKISGRIVCELATAMPRKQEQERILRCLAGADSRLAAEVDRASVLRDIKFGLMDDLLTGRIRVTPLLEGAVP